MRKKNVVCPMKLVHYEKKERQNISKKYIIRKKEDNVW